jgi:hypothetical protein
VLIWLESLRVMFAPHLVQGAVILFRRRFFLTHHDRHNCRRNMNHDRRADRVLKCRFDYSYFEDRIHGFEVNISFDFFFLVPLFLGSEK